VERIPLSPAGKFQAVISTFGPKLDGVR